MVMLSSYSLWFFMRKVNISISGVLLAFTGYYAYLVSRLPTRKIPYTLGADFMPWVLTVCLLFLSTLLLLISLFSKGESERVGGISLKEVGGILSLLAIIVVYIGAMIYFGYVFITPLFIAAMMLISGSRKLEEIILFPIGITLAVYLFFHRLFDVPLPGGKIF
jgi:lysylphosphatidylglycerol synthetase-like protein (DUF2156 family)